jgi:hypothetical protein
MNLEIFVSILLFIFLKIFCSSLFSGHGSGLCNAGASALGVTALIKKINQTVAKQCPKKVAIACTIYGAIMIASYLVMPSNPDKISISMNLVEAFRLVSASTIVMFWEILGATFATLWNRFTQHNLYGIGLTRTISKKLLPSKICLFLD